MEAFQSGTFLRDESIVVSLRRQLLMASVPLALFELLAAAWPVYALMSFDKLDRVTVVQVGAPLYALALVAWVSVYGSWIRPIAKLTKERSAGTLTSSVTTPDGEHLGIGVVRMAHALPGAQFQAGDATATVIDLAGVQRPDLREETE